MIEVENLVKRYGATVAVNNVSFKVQKGEIVGFLGPNGAGKSTTLKIVTCYIVADSGKAVVDGYDVLEDSLEVRRRIGYLPESTPLYSDMQVMEYLNFVAKARHLSAAASRDALDRVVQMAGIERMLKKNIAFLSKGYRQRVGLAQALLHDPPILIMDEPTSGLDPHQIIEIRELIRELGKTKVVVLSSHILQEISAICTRILIIKDGKIVADGTPIELQSSVDEGRVLVARIQGPDAEIKDALLGLDGVDRVDVTGQSDGAYEFRAHATSARDLGGDLFDLAKDRGWTLLASGTEQRSLEDVYLKLTEDSRRKAAS